MSQQTKTRRKAAVPTTQTLLPASKAPSRLDQLESLLRSDTGTSIAEMIAATGWQQHSVRGAMGGALRKRGLAITSSKTDGLRRYRAELPS